MISVGRSRCNQVVLFHFLLKKKKMSREKERFPLSSVVMEVPSEFCSCPDDGKLMAKKERKLAKMIQAEKIVVSQTLM